MIRDDLIPLLDEAVRFLDRPDPVLLSGTETKAFTARALDLIGRIKDADDRVVVGLVGGTGVGKSTLIDALAGEEISTRTEVRPTTTHLVLYRHRDNDFSLAEDEEVHRHAAEPLRKVTLADFPDFDSIEPAHRDLLGRLFPRLDLLLWVVDPVKYADRAFFDWLALAPQARVNSLFVFNKLDEYRARYGREAEDVAEQVAADFRGKLGQYAGIDAPEILFVSALEALQGDGARGNGGFAALVGRLEDLREKKLRQAVKRGNIEQMTSRLLTDVRQTADLETAERVLTDLRRCIEQGNEEVRTQLASEAEALTSVLGRPWRAGLTAGARDKAPWPLDFFLFIWDRLIGLVSRRAREGRGEVDLPRPDLAALSRRLAGWRSGATSVLGARENGSARGWARVLEKLPSAEEVARRSAEALVQAGRDGAQAITRKHRWRIAHHLLPLLVLAYPLLPFVPALLGGPESGAKVVLNVGWRDMLTLVEVLVGLYLVETVYFVYSLDRTAGRALAGLIREWADRAKEVVTAEVFTPAVAFADKLEVEIEAVRRLARDFVPKG